MVNKTANASNFPVEIYRDFLIEFWLWALFFFDYKIYNTGANTHGFPDEALVKLGCVAQLVSRLFGDPPKRRE